MGGNDDTFFSSGDRTILKPTPGGRRRQQNPPPGGTDTRAPAPPPPAHYESGDLAAARSGFGGNPLLDAAAPLLALASELRTTPDHPDPNGLLEHVGREVHAFEVSAQGNGVSPQAVIAARYALCTFLDEIVLNTPWGGNSGWASHSLLMRFHKEGWGGEKFFQIIERLQREPSKNRELLELMYVCLSLGFQGKFKVQQNGAAHVERVREDLGALLQSIRPEPERGLSPHWQGVADLRPRLARYLPLWAVAAVTAALLLATFVGLRLALATDGGEAFVQLQKLGRDMEPLVRRQAPPPPVTNLAAFLAPEVQAGLVEVQESPGETLIRLNGSGLFASGSARVQPDRTALLQRVAAALQEVPGRVVVAGHTDSDPVPGSLRLKFASNWELSQQRAEAVRALLEEAGVRPDRLSAEGRADTEPLVANDSRANKARNRRVEILLQPQATGI